MEPPLNKCRINEGDSTSPPGKGPPTGITVTLSPTGDTSPIPGGATPVPIAEMSQGWVTHPTRDAAEG